MKEEKTNRKELIRLRFLDLRRVSGTRKSRASVNGFGGNAVESRALISEQVICRKVSMSFFAFQQMNSGTDLERAKTVARHLP
jgi:hypothetical protein